MATITTTQIKSRVKHISEESLGKAFAGVGEAIEYLDDLISDIENEIDCIEPYEGKDDLTDAQQERQDKLDEMKSTLEEIRDNLDSIQGDIATNQEDLDCIE